MADTNTQAQQTQTTSPPAQLHKSVSSNVWRAGSTALLTKQGTLSLTEDFRIKLTIDDKKIFDVQLSEVALADFSYSGWLFLTLSGVKYKLAFFKPDFWFSSPVRAVGSLNKIEQAKTVASTWEFSLQESNKKPSQIIPRGNALLGKRETKTAIIVFIVVILALATLQYLRSQ